MHKVLVSDRVLEFLEAMDEKSRSICKKNLQKLTQPYPGRGPGDKEKLVVLGEELFRLHIGRTYTAFYIIDEEKKLARVIELLTIESAHKKYGY
jgi:mRNA-degrading endonuclease RelE of RelBE toxin-antitoxin system